ncbi:hypothetical protein [Planctomyces sp. SH-PL62]|uniref:hypothetical protein n=1 Tax=Planctomyces sp. SH-PL62 TaxID=1636152 RepID=UPI0018D3376B|nr:hypothetical protein [Planctomyces sp. SH-PL62]
MLSSLFLNPSARAAEPLPVGSNPPALGAEPFPDRLHAFVWRNWELVPAAKLAEVVGASADRIEAVAASMGLPPAVGLDPETRSRVYITILRRNWHLLPYDQILTLLDMSPAKLAFALREDDFLYIKLGSLKPRCEPLRYAEPTPEARARASAIKEVVESRFGAAIVDSGEPPMAFRRRWEAAPAGPEAGAGPGADASRTAAETGPRFASSYFGTYGDALAEPGRDGFPDGLLAELAEQGVNGVWLHVVLRTLAPGGPDFPEFGEGSAERLANLRSLIERAGRRGVKVYLYLNEPRAMPLSFFATRPEMKGVVDGAHAVMCTSDDRVRSWMKRAVEHVAREAPGLGGVFTITASENVTSCASHGRIAECPRCSKRTPAEVIAEVNATIAEGLRAGAPDAKFIAWDWGWIDPAQAAATIARLPRDAYFQTVAEWDLPIERGGVKTTVGEYSLSATGPSDRARLRWGLARDAGLKTSAKVQLNATWELAAVPSIPVYDLVADLCRNLAEARVDSMMLGWSLGGCPSPQLRVAQLFAEDPTATPDAVLDRVAAERFGADAAPQARLAWSAFSRAFREYPYHGVVLYNGPQQMGPANPLHERATGYRATMVGFPYDDLDGWCGPYPARVFADQFRKVADGWAAGIPALREAVLGAPAPLRAAAEADLGVAEAVGLHFASVANQADFVIARSRDDRDAMRRLLDAEIQAARSLYPLARRDSRLGFEASNHYFYRPLDLVEKVVGCEALKARLATP